MSVDASGAVATQMAGIIEVLKASQEMQAQMAEQLVEATVTQNIQTVKEHYLGEAIDILA
jgi:hypothetical protein